MKHILLGIAGLLMLVFNLLYFYSRADTTVNSSYALVHPADNATVNQFDCIHDCTACGRCLPVSDINIMETYYSLNEAAYECQYF